MRPKKQQQRVKVLLTALNQAPRERFTFEYGCCSSKDEFYQTQEREREREDRKGTVTVHHEEKWEMEETLQY